MVYRPNRTGLNAGEADQGYFVSVSDMMAGLLFLFIIILMVFVINFHKETVKKEIETKKKKDEIKTVQQEIKKYNKIQDELTDAKLVRKQLLEDLKESLEQQGVTVRIDTEKGILHVPEDILFLSGKAQFQAGGEQSLMILSKNLAEKLPCYAGRREAERPSFCNESKFKPGRLEAVLVEGHTDNVPIKSATFENNWDLSAKRSIRTFQYLLQAKPVLASLLNAEGDPLFGVSGYAETRPVVAHKDITPEPLNRRIDLRFILAPPKPQESDDLSKKVGIE